MKSKTKSAYIYTILHMLVDFTTIYLISGVLLGTSVRIVNRAEVIIIYNLVAFAGQLPIGIIADTLRCNSRFALWGCIMAGISYPVALISPWTACILASVGNGAFHIGAGAEILKVSMPKASLAGIFVSSGALGVWFAYKVSGGIFMIICPFVMLISCILILIFAKDSSADNTVSPEKYSIPKITTLLIAVCFLLTIVIRSFLGMVIDFPWKALPLWSFISVMAVAGGKALGGIAADKFGYTKTSMISLAVSLIAFVFSFDLAICGVIAILCFNMTMPLTLTALAQMCGKKYGFAFGLTTFALAIGFIPVVFGAGSYFGLSLIIYLVVISLVLLYIGVKCRKLN